MVDLETSSGGTGDRLLLVLVGVGNRRARGDETLGALPGHCRRLSPYEIGIEIEVEIRAKARGKEEETRRRTRDGENGAESR